MLREACGSDAALRATLERMLRADGTPHPLLDGGVVFAARPLVGRRYLRALRNRRADRARRHGRGVSGAGRLVEPRRGAQSGVGRHGHAWHRTADCAVAPGGADPRGAQSSKHRQHSWTRGSGRRTRARARVRGRRDAGRSAPGRTDDTRGCRRVRSTDCGGARSRARAGHRPSRSQAVERQAAAGQHRQAAGLRPGEGRASGAASADGGKSPRLVERRPLRTTGCSAPPPT